MRTRVSYTYEVKMKVIEMRLASVPIKQIIMDLNIRNKTQVETWMRWEKASTNAKSRQAIERRIGELCRANKFRYGYRKITALLRQVIATNHKVVQIKVKKQKLTGQRYAIITETRNGYHVPTI